MKNQLVLATALLATFATPLAASAQPFGGRGGMMMHHGNNYGNNRSASGRIASVQGSSFTLDNGRTIFSRKGTQINGRIHPGAFVNVIGFGAGDHNINATSITVMHRR